MNCLEAKLSLLSKLVAKQENHSQCHSKIYFLDVTPCYLCPLNVLNVYRGSCVVLTTHSMEEADILADRIAIIAKGRLRCLGTRHAAAREAPHASLSGLASRKSPRKCIWLS
jgi:hypothetical protein